MSLRKLFPPSTSPLRRISPRNLLGRLATRRFGPWIAAVMMLVGLALATPWLIRATPAAEEPVAAVADGIILERIPGVAAGEMLHLRVQRERLAEDAANLPLAVDLGWQFLRLWESTGDLRFNGYLRSALAPWWELTEPPHQVLLLRAAARRSAQDFKAAAEDLELYLSLRPENLNGWLQQARLQRLRGDLVPSQVSCQTALKLAEGDPERLQAAACSALADDSSTPDVYLRLRDQFRQTPNVDEATQSEVLSALAKLALRWGRLDEAEEALRQALLLDPNDTALLVRYANLLLDQDRSREVLRLLGEQTTVSTLLVRLVEAEQRLGLAEYKPHAARLEASFETARREGSRRHLADEARFRLRCQQRPWKALRLALSHWEQQRRPEDARLVLEAAWLAQEPELARPVLGFLEQAGWEGQRLNRLVRRLGEVS